MHEPGLEERHLQAELHARIHQQEVVADLGQRALQDLDLQVLMDEVSQKVAQTLEVEFCKILELLPDGQGLLLRSGVGWKEGSVGHATVGVDTESQAGYALLYRGPVIVEDLQGETRFSDPEFLQEHGVVSGMSVIIQGKWGPYGVLGVHTRERRAYTRDDIHFLQSVANILAEAIRRERSRQELEAFNAELEHRIADRTALLQLLQDIAMASNEASSIKVAMKFALSKICAYTGWPIGHVYFVEETTDVTLKPGGVWLLKDPEKYEGFRELTEATPLARGEGFVGRVYESTRPTWIEDVSQDPGFSHFQMAGEVGIKSAFAFPVLVEEEVVAILEFYTPEAREPNEALLEVITHVGTQLGRVVERSRAEEELRNSRSRLAEAQALAHLGSWQWDIKKDIVTWSDELFRIYGLTPGESSPSFESFLERVHPDDRPMVDQLIQKSLQDHQPFDVDHRIVRPDGSVRVLHTQGEIVVEHGEIPVGMHGTSQDITKRHRLEKELLEVPRQLIASRELERLKLAQELHDEPLQDLYVILYDLHELAEGSPAVDGGVQEMMREAVQTLNRVIEKLRVICGELRPPALAPFGLEGAIREHAEQFRAENPEIDLRLDLKYDGQILSEQERLTCYRIYQQAMMNVVRHAKASAVDVRFSYDEVHIILEVKDNGQGFDVPLRWVALARQGHLGLAGAAERAELMGGTLRVISSPGKGTLIRIVLSRSKEAEVEM